MLKQISVLILSVFFAISSPLGAMDAAPSTPTPPTRSGLTLTLDLAAKKICDPRLSLEIVNLVNTNQSNQILHQIRMAQSTKTLTPLVKDIFLLEECPCSSLSRKYVPWVRAQFEDSLIQKIEQIHPNKSQPLVYTSIGSGRLFQDFVILTKLISRGFRIKVNLIDQSFEPFLCHERNNVGPNGIVMLTDPPMLNLEGLLELTKHLLHPAPIIYKKTFIQLLNWFESLKIRFPFSPSSITVYSSTDQYLADCANSRNLKANILTCVDLEYHDQEIAPQLIDQFPITTLMPLVKIGGVAGFLEKKFFPQSLKELRETLTADVVIQKHNQEFKYSVFRCILEKH